MENMLSAWRVEMADMRALLLMRHAIGTLHARVQLPVKWLHIQKIKGWGGGGGGCLSNWPSGWAIPYSHGGGLQRQGDAGEVSDALRHTPFVDWTLLLLDEYHPLAGTPQLIYSDAYLTCTWMTKWQGAMASTGLTPKELSILHL